MHFRRSQKSQDYSKKYRAGRSSFVTFARVALEQDVVEGQVDFSVRKQSLAEYEEDLNECKGRLDERQEELAATEAGLNQQREELNQQEQFLAQRGAQLADHQRSLFFGGPVNPAGSQPVYFMGVPPVVGVLPRHLYTMMRSGALFR